MFPFMDRVRELATTLARTWLHATVYRTVWSLPLPVVLAVAALLFLLLVLFG